MYIQMVTALVLQLIQCVVHLPSDKDSDDDNDRKVRITVSSSDMLWHFDVDFRAWHFL